MEAFYTVQGEGYHQGRAAYFIRLGGCDVGCVWCDVKESWDVSKFPHVSVDEIVKEADKHTARIAVVTGGEPLMHNLDALTYELKSSGFSTHIETSGAYPLSGEWDWICFSPKKFKSPLLEVAEKAQELKVIIYNQSDFEFAKQNARLINENCKKYLQPEWSRFHKVMPSIVAFVKDNPDWEISLQIHKFMDVP
ncbi:MAG: 7-carboxy-7-deazaguanine synthase QueE [Cyclobacteriaceae bacterium]|nr:7-carboxy-7-deazaguanine synthase QueE [Cyclobacteriaceae bacterium]